MAELSRYWCGGQFQAPRVVGNDNSEHRYPSWRIVQQGRAERI